ncbi:MAG: ABC-2 transporter permease [Bacillus sp. (in: Bacteria)]|nr:ABC-2 transporter permease [Bacillus sp. (in: firmicutes)]MCM1426624.1 ABC-2 transporter permease [Eubacterium sp.]
MKGLFLKDLKLIWYNKRLFLAILLVMVIASRNYGNYSFLIAYGTMIFILLVLNTISLDEYYKSTSFWMTTPIKRVSYVAEKYILMFAFSFLGTVLMSLACVLMHPESAVQSIIVAFLIYLVMAVVQLIMLPIQLKFSGENGEKARMILLGLLAVVTVLSASLVKSFPRIFSMDGVAGEFIRNIVVGFLSLQKGVMALLICLVFAAGAAVSYCVSRRVMLAREF